METAAQPRPQPPKSLNKLLNNDEPPANGTSQLRDSGFYSTGDISSKHTSSASFNSHGLSPAASGYQSSTDKTPSPIAGHMSTNHPVISPTAPSMSVAHMVSPTATHAPEYRALHHQRSMDSGHSSATMDGATLARRESVDSRINQGISNIQLSNSNNNNSPYASHNPSTTSFQSTLHSQRNPRSGLETPPVHRISNGYAPHNDRNPDPKYPRTAPTITGPTTSHIARAAEPVKGQAWAFPEDQDPRYSQHSAYDLSRRSSISESIASSQFTADSRLPPGQRRLDDGPSPPAVPEIPLQHRQVSGLQDDGMTGNQPYSRTPELRVSHKLAERKRRTEMKELFDNLRDQMPQERGTKASKWEILTKAIEEHKYQASLIAQLRHENNKLRQENEAMRSQMSGYRVEAPPPAPAHHAGAAAPPPQPHANHAPYATEYSSGSRTGLPPLRSLGPDNMTGVQYEGTPNGAGYRHI